jgi:hypothetical protein
MKKIGFVDYYISEWHANNYPGWMAGVEGLGSEYKIAYGWAELDASPEDGVTTAEWCEKYGAEKCDTIEELCEKSDVIVILAPSNPEKHLGYAEKVLPYGKRTYIDKTFAPDLETAKKIFAIAEKYNTPFFSTSALRYSTELDEFGKCDAITTTGCGDTINEYIVHQIEMLVKKMGIGAATIRSEKMADQIIFHINYNDNREAMMVYGHGIPFSVYMMAQGEAPKYKAAKSSYFKILMADILRFFEEGTVSFDTNETLEVMKIRDGALKAEVAIGETVTL